MDNDSQAVLALKAKLQESYDRPTDGWELHHRKWLRARIRAQRLSEARQLGTHTKEEWAALVARLDRRCVICGCWPEGGPCKDHIKPIYLGGSDAIENLQPVCRECNTAKGADNFNWAEFRLAHGFIGCEEWEE